MADATMTPLRMKIKAIMDNLPAVPTNAQNAKALKQLLQLIDDMEVARINAAINGPAAVMVIK